MANSKNATDCRPSSKDDVLDLIYDQDSECSNICELNKVDRSYFYNWGQEHFRFARGTALIFHDDTHVSYASSLKQCFQSLGYVVEISDTAQMLKFICKHFHTVYRTYFN